MVVSKLAFVNVLLERTHEGQRYVYFQIANGLTFEWMAGTQVVHVKKYPDVSSPPRVTFTISKKNPCRRAAREACMNYANGMPY